MPTLGCSFFFGKGGQNKTGLGFAPPPPPPRDFSSELCCQQKRCSPTTNLSFDGLIMSPSVLFFQPKSSMQKELSCFSCEPLPKLNGRHGKGFHVGFALKPQKGYQLPFSRCPTLLGGFLGRFPLVLFTKQNERGTEKKKRVCVCVAQLATLR